MVIPTAGCVVPLVASSDILTLHQKSSCDPNTGQHVFFTYPSYLTPTPACLDSSYKAARRNVPDLNTLDQENDRRTPRRCCFPDFRYVSKAWVDLDYDIYSLSEEMHMDPDPDFVYPIEDFQKVLAAAEGQSALLS